MVILCRSKLPYIAFVFDIINTNKTLIFLSVLDLIPSMLVHVRGLRSLPRYCHYDIDNPVMMRHYKYSADFTAPVVAFTCSDSFY